MAADPHAERHRRLAVGAIVTTALIAGVLTGTEGHAQEAGSPCVYTRADGSLMITDDLSDPHCSHLRPQPRRRSAAPARASFRVREIVALAHWMAAQYRVDSRLVVSLIEVESGYDPRAVSSKGAVGLMQLMPALSSEYGVDDPYDIWQNLQGGILHLRDLLVRYDSDLEKVLAAYNAGAGAVDRYDGVPPYAETREYVRRVLQHYRTRVAETASPGVGY